LNLFFAIRVKYCLERKFYVETYTAERSDLRSQAHGLKPIVLIGEAGLSETVVKEIDAGLNAHSLIKVRVFGDDREARSEMYDTICAD
jgi:putative YhbY family RNA-binding protein